MVVRIRNLTGIARLDVDFGASSILDSYLPVGEISCAHAPTILKSDPITQIGLQPHVDPLRSKRRGDKQNTKCGVCISLASRLFSLPRNRRLEKLLRSLQRTMGAVLGMAAKSASGKINARCVA